MREMIFDIEPVPASRPRVGQYGTYYNAKYQQFKDTMDILILKEKKTLYEQPLRADITFFVKIPASYSEKKKKEMDGTYCVSNFDLDNLEKSIYDSMNGYIYVDDKQIVEHCTRKKWVKEKPRIHVIISPL